MHPLCLLPAYASQWWGLWQEGAGRGWLAAEILAAHLGKNYIFNSMVPLSVHARCIHHCQEQMRRQFTWSLL